MVDSERIYTVGSLFSGIGGWDLGFEATGRFRTIWFAESDPFRQTVLRDHWPNVPIYDDVRFLSASDPRPEVLCASFPCIDVSTAGKRAGIDGAGSGIWTEIIRLVRLFRPRYLFMENVTGIRRHGFERLLAELAACGYDAEWDCIPAAAVGSPQERDRVWIVAYPDSFLAGFPWVRFFGADWERCLERAAEAGRGQWESEPGLDRVVDGFPGRVDRLAALGDSVVPAITEALARRAATFDATIQLIEQIADETGEPDEYGSRLEAVARSGEAGRGLSLQGGTDAQDLRLQEGLAVQAPGGPDS